MSLDDVQSKDTTHHALHTPSITLPASCRPRGQYSEREFVFVVVDAEFDDSQFGMHCQRQLRGADECSLNGPDPFIAYDGDTR